jgi:hypothetical protein
MHRATADLDAKVYACDREVSSFNDFGMPCYAMAAAAIYIEH